MKINKVEKKKKTKFLLTQKLKKKPTYWATAACIQLETQPVVGPGCRPAKAQ